MVITGEKPVQETGMVGWKVIQKDVEVTKFTKAFKIPDGVIFDKVKTKFNEEDSVLMITMPKRVNGIPGIGIEEMKEPELADKIPKRVTFQVDNGAESRANSVSTYREEEKKENEKELPLKPLEEKSLADQVSQETEMQYPSFPSNIQEAHEEVEKHAVEDELVPQMEPEMPKVEPQNQEMDDIFQEKRETHSDDKPECANLEGDKVCEKANGIQEEKEETSDLSRTREEDQDKLPERKWKKCVPVVAGSAVILSLVVFVIHFMRTKNQTDKRKG